MVVLTLASSSYAKMDSAPSATLYSKEEPSGVEMSCYGVKPFKNLNCKFVQKSVRQKKDSVAKFDADLAKLSPSAFEGMKKELTSSCSDKKLSKRFIAFTEPESKYKDKQKEIFNASCRCLNVADTNKCIVTAFREDAVIRSKTCGISVNSFEEDFHKISENKWMNTPEPKGLCNIVTATTLEFDGEYKWTYSQTRISVDKTEFCSVFEINKPYIFESNLYGGILKLDCEVIDLGTII